MLIWISRISPGGNGLGQTQSSFSCVSSDASSTLAFSISSALKAKSRTMNLLVQISWVKS